MKKIILFSLVSLFANTIYSQKAAKSVYLEGLGPGLLISANFDTRFAKKENGWGGRAGIGVLAGYGVTGLTIPIGINYLAGNKHYLEAGAGVTLATAVGTFNNFGGTATTLIGNISIGYRYQPKSNGVLFRIAFDPIFNSNAFLPYAGIAVGYKF